MNHAIILAAGSGERLESKTDKMLSFVAGKPLIYYTLVSFNDHPDLSDIVLVVNKKNRPQIEKMIKEYHFSKIKKIVLGGKSRQGSLEKGFKVLQKPAKDDVVLVHNGANPLVSEYEITSTIAKTADMGACIVGHYITSTVKEVDDQHVIKTHNREKLFAAETPQGATYSILKKALEAAKKSKLGATDEAMMLEAIDQKVAFIPASENNFKVTRPSDLKRLADILGEMPEDVRIGIGQDSHMFDKEKTGLVLAGVEFPNEQKLEANSDGDVILHAIFNGISQAIGEKSLGFYADPMCEKGEKNSAKYLEVIVKKMKKQGYKVNSLGIMLECKKPKIDPQVSKMRKNLSDLLDLPTRNIGITATTGEELTAFGKGLGIQCFAIVSLRK